MTYPTAIQALRKFIHMCAVRQNQRTFPPVHEDMSEGVAQRVVLVPKHKRPRVWVRVRQLCDQTYKTRNIKCVFMHENQIACTWKEA